MAHNALEPAVSYSSSCNGQQPDQQPSEEVFDKWIDTHWADLKGDTEKTKMEYAKEPWNHFRDAQNAYLSIRMNKRESFLRQMDQKTKKNIQDELDRIGQTRAIFEKSDESKKELMKQLEDSRNSWKSHVQNKSSEHKAGTTKGHQKAKGRDSHSETKCLPDIAVSRRTSATLPTPACADRNQEDQNQKSPGENKLYEFKAGVTFFKRAESDDWVGHTLDVKENSLLSGDKFPNQKIAVKDILTTDEGNPLASPCDDNIMRWFHFPTNSMYWAEKAIERYYSRDKEQCSPLSREHWRGQMHGTECPGFPGHETNTKGPIHARHMRSRCSVIPRDTNATPSGRIRNSKDLAFFLPYLHWETSSRRAKMVDVVNEATGSKQKKKKHISTYADRLSPKKRSVVIDPRCTHINFTRTPIKPRTPLGAYLMRVAEVADKMDYEADERLLRNHIGRDPPLHIRRTLDQYYFLTLADTSARDKDQVVYRGTKDGKSFHTRNTRVVMVDQLWMWILDDHTIITSFPRRWGRNKPDSSGVHKSLRERLKGMTNRKEGIKSIHHLAVIIIDQCSRVFFDRTKPLDERPEVMDLFSSAIGHVTQCASIANDNFWRHSRLHSMGMLPTNNYRYLDINPEGVLLREAQDIAEELKIMLRIYTEQGAVVKEFRRYLGRLKGELKGDVAIMHRLIEVMERSLPDGNSKGDERDSTQKQQHPKRPWLDDTIDHVDILMESIQNRKMEIQDLEQSILRTQHHLEGLLQLKQQQASIVEAKASLKRQEESIRQGRAIMALTIVTICFLPLGFFAAFFGMNNDDINDAKWMTLNEQVKYMFGLSTLVIAVSVGLAFSPWTRALTSLLVRVPLVYIGEFTRIRSLWNSTRINHRSLEGYKGKALEHVLERRRNREKAEQEQKKNKNEFQAGKSANTDGYDEERSRKETKGRMLERLRPSKERTRENDTYV